VVHWIVVVVAVDGFHNKFIHSGGDGGGHLCDLCGYLFAQPTDDALYFDKELVLAVLLHLLQQGILAGGVARQQVGDAELQDAEDEVEVVGVF
jgi:hypothetical protein